MYDVNAFAKWSRSKSTKNSLKTHSTIIHFSVHIIPTKRTFIEKCGCKQFLLSNSKCFMLILTFVLLSLCSFELVSFLTYYRNVLRYEIRFEISLKISSKKLRQQLLRLTVIVCVRGVKESKLLNKGSKQWGVGLCFV